MKRTYAVHISQINQQRIEVKADNAAQARKLAIAKWRRDYAWPIMTETSEIQRASAGDPGAARECAEDA